ncbi:neurotrimin [Osmerus mordax]|uniref:neurotrimin n=1 Tax=Osmerus mordax TaxID=8014 RepID=UPI00350FF163
MRLQYCLCCAVALQWLMPGGSQSVSVQIQTPQPVHVLPATGLLLQAQLSPQVSSVAWEREPEHGSHVGKVTLAVFPGNPSSGRVRLKQQGAVLSLEGFTTADSGRYTVTVTDRSGATATAECMVTEYVAVHHVSVSVNASHASLFCAEAWGSEPRFTWLHDNAAVTTALGRVSADGKTLFFSSTPVCGHFTCVVSNRLGHSSATYTAEPCRREGGGGAGVWAWLLVLLVLGGVLAFLLWRRRRQMLRRGERLQEHLEENL